MVVLIICLAGSIAFINYIGNLNRLNEDAKNKIDRVNKLNENLTNEIGNLNKLNENAKNKMNRLNKLNENLISTNNGLEKVIKIQNKTINDLTNQHHEYINKSDKIIENLTNCLDDFEKENKKLNDSLNDMKIQKNILFISDYFSGIRNINNEITTAYLYLLLSKVHFIILDIIDSVSVKSYELNNFNKYSAIVFDMVDSGYQFKNSKFCDVIVDYLKEGGSIFFYT